MNTKDILEIRRRFTKDSCTITRLCGCYVDADKNKITTFNETFLNLEDEEFYKYLDMIKAMFKGKVAEKLGDNLLECKFVQGQQGASTAQLLQLRSDLKNDEALEAFYDMVIDSYDYIGHYLILVAHDAYDVITKTSDNNEIDESEDVYEYLICAICPVGLTAPGLSYKEDENRIAPRIRDWVVGAPNSGFLYPAFTDRKEDREHVLFYSKDAAEPRHELVEYGLQCEPKLTGTEKRNMFEKAVEQTLGEDLLEDALMKINAAMWEMPVADGETPDKNRGIVDEMLMREVLESTEIPEKCIEEILERYTQVFELGYPEGCWLFNKKYYKKSVDVQQKKYWKDLAVSAAKELERVTKEESELTKRILAEAR